MAASSDPLPSPPASFRNRVLAALAAIAAVAVVLTRFPLFHVVPLAPPTEAVAPKAAAAFDPTAYAEKFWSDRVLPAAARATEAASVLQAMRQDPVAAARRYAHHVGLGGTAYYFVRGIGKVTGVDKNAVRVAVTGADGGEVALRVGPVFGNTLRDGTGLLNVNEFASLQEFNALAAELNHIAETRVTAALRERARAGMTLAFAGCAEAPESVGSGPAFVVIPVRCESEP
jgi:predicted lipoprotein